MGSTLGRKRKILTTPFGSTDRNLRRAFDAARATRWRAQYRTRVLLISYLKIKLTLEAAGFDATFHPSTGGKAPIP